ncbi:MAG: hypothetical protein HFG68_14590 [Hungatella sp.]|nr:hypothetical protein [Hungatella sp.]
MAIKKLSYQNLQELTGEMKKKFVQKTDKVGEDNLSEELKAIITGKADAATTLAGYGITDGMTATQIATAISAAIAGADHLQRTIVASVDDIDLSAPDAGQFIYLVPNRTEPTAGEETAEGESAETVEGESTQTATDGNAYEEYMVINGALERMGDWKVDLSDYAKTADVLKAIASVLTVQPIGTGNVITGFHVNSETGSVEIEKGITALQESDMEEYTSQEIQALFT